MVKSLNRIVENTTAKLRASISKWYIDTKHLQLASKLSEEKKKTMIGLLQKMVLDREAQGVPSIINAFYKNYKVTSVQRKVLRKILECKAGKIAQYYL